MAQSATDAGHGEKTIRKEVVETGDVDIVVSIGTNFFYTRSLPCSLWFFDRGRPEERRDKVLMLDARNIYRVVSRKIRDFSDEQRANLTAIVWLYRGETDRYLALVEDYFGEVLAGLGVLQAPLEAVDKPVGGLLEHLDSFVAGGLGDSEAVEEFVSLVEELHDSARHLKSKRQSLLAELGSWASGPGAGTKGTNREQVELAATFERFGSELTGMRRQVNEVHKLAIRAVDHARKNLGADGAGGWAHGEVRALVDELGSARELALDAVRAISYPFAQVTWLQSRFPDARMEDVPGLCKVVDRDGIEGQDWSLTPGRYVGVAPREPEDEEHVEERLREIHVELAGLNQVASELAEAIKVNFQELIG